LMAHLLKKLIREESGAAVVEAAIVFPVLITLAFGVFEFSNAFFDHQEITTGVRDAARYFARLPVQAANDNPCADNAGEIANAQNIAVYGTSTAGGKPRVAGWTPGSVAINCVAVPNPTNPATGEPSYRGPQPSLYIIQVQTAVAYPQFGLLTYLGLPAPTFTLTDYERWIGG
jgi:Flp pilus assembly protein TadG